MENEGLIFIPDISGFTKFVTETELEHSQMIITQLLELLINLNHLDLNLSEIEGDAILFYKKGSRPAVNDVMEQSKKMFIDFHQYLKEMSGINNCNCGACTAAPGLSLKFITHYGQVNEVKIHNFTKILGSDVILAHRLLKNNIHCPEYLLMTKSFFSDQARDNIKKEDWMEFLKTIEEYENFGKVELHYIPLTPLLNKGN